MLFVLHDLSLFYLGLVLSNRIPNSRDFIPRKRTFIYFSFSFFLLFLRTFDITLTDWIEDMSAENERATFSLSLSLSSSSITSAFSFLPFSLLFLTCPNDETFLFFVFPDM